MNKELEPRLSVLEEGHKAIQRDLLNLSGSVKEQGVQLTSAILELSNKITTATRIDWQTIFAFITVIVILIAAISTPVWMNFSYVAENAKNIELTVNKASEIQFENIKEQTKVSIKQEMLEERLNRIEMSLSSRKSYNEQP